MSQDNHEPEDVSPEGAPPAEEHHQNSEFEEAQKLSTITWADIKEHMPGPVISFVAHLVAITLCFIFITGTIPEEQKDLDVQMKEVEVKPFEPPPEPPPPEEVEEVEVEVEVEKPDNKPPAQDPDVTVVTDVVVTSPVQSTVDVPNVVSVKPSNSALRMPALFSSRTSAGRKGAIKSYGGSGKTENCVLKGLRWLRDHQLSDGSWATANDHVKRAMTGLALMAFLAHGDTPQSAEFGACVQKAIQWLTADIIGKPGGGQPWPYSNAIATYAISEAYGMTRIPKCKEAMNTGIERIIKGMNAKGGIDYDYKQSDRSDLSVSAWNYQAMKAAYAAGCDVKGLEEALYKAIKCLKEVYAIEQGYKGFYYSVEGGKGSLGGGHHTMVGAGTLCLLLLGEGNSTEAKNGLRCIEDRFTNNPTFKIDWNLDKTGGLYAWYYNTQAIFQGTQGKGELWKKWNEHMKKNLTRAQQADGHWDKPTGEAHENLNPGGAGFDEEVYITALSCLSLEVYYRFLPTFKGGLHRPEPAGEAKGGDKKGDDDLGLTIL